MARTKYEINYTWLSCCGRWLLSPAHVLNKKQPHRYTDTKRRCRYKQTDSAGKCVCCDILQVICWLNFQSEWRARSFGAGWGSNGCGRGCGTGGGRRDCFWSARRATLSIAQVSFAIGHFPERESDSASDSESESNSDPELCLLYVRVYVLYGCVCALFNSR